MPSFYVTMFISHATEASLLDQKRGSIDLFFIQKHERMYYNDKRYIPKQMIISVSYIQALPSSSISHNVSRIFSFTVFLDARVLGLSTYEIGEKQSLSSYGIFKLNICYMSKGEENNLWIKKRNRS
ncbi:hypothetical protein C4A77_09325 [Brevibacillus laterosporus]|uniref:Uncharacterized protein n=1 Tax=Brevibacillus laterosporus TaxID=1465 RepID=A0AAP8QDS2_BRELA|nr:hypothetical protein C4A77_09325 [Brevibacillus laterosporus]